MANIVEITVPEMGESITEGTLATWLKNPGDAVEADEPIAEIETDKVTVELPAPAAGVLVETLKNPGDTVQVHEVVAKIDTNGAKADIQKSDVPQSKSETKPETVEKAPAEKEPMPAAKRIMVEEKIQASEVQGTGRSGQITKQDVIRHLNQTKKEVEQAPAKELPKEQPASKIAKKFEGEEPEEVVPMSRLRRAIAENLVNVQHTAAILTTFNEINMQPVMELRSKYKEEFQKKHGIKLGFMSFFTKAVVRALQEFPAINAEIRGTDIVYKHYYHIGIAVGGPKGLVVPVVRHADKLSLAEIEMEIARLAEKVRNGTIALSDLSGGTFSITNGGIYGSMMSTPILNPPQSGILGMHNIVKRAVVENDEIVIRPMMYVALSYDHRIVDGKEAVQFLVTVKNCVEDPARLLLEV
ncbi:MAG: 2-oxoglutarate dehydrogenase complex dihydrolipoyllysine-residue succinyltransferase [Candidatus Hydrogenedentota bacterium]|nr:MAG: 2-oxoglutarate dehydrogenase complex dihydrolipoyllysine-residue succinyltransferase [Candidatus Hydrogenedentota bacterium]